MNSRLARMLVRLYPRWWRQRYGEEFTALLEEQPLRLRSVLDVLRGALAQRLAAADYGDTAMADSTGTLLRFSRVPSAVLPIALSLAAVSVLVVSLALTHWTVVRGHDEDTAVHLYQLCMVGQAPVSLYFVFKWLPRAPRRALGVLALQLGAAFVAVAPVYFLGL